MKDAPDGGSATVALALAGAMLIASAIAVWMLDESEWPMFVLGLVGLVAGRLVGVPARHLAVIAVGVAVVAWPLAVFSSPIPRATSTLAHLGVAALAAWVLTGPLRRRWPATRAQKWSARWFLIPALVLAIGLIWELGEWAADAVFGTDLAVRPADTAADLVADFAGAVGGVALRDRIGRPAQGEEPAVAGR